MSKVHRIAADVSEELFKFYQSILPHGERGNLLPKLLSDLKSIHNADKTLIRKYMEGKITILDFRKELEKCLNL